jgi:LppP/LprE lipoprotein
MAGQLVSGRRRRRWPARVGAVMGTTALLGTGAAIVVMILPSESEDAVVPSAPAATPTSEADEPRPKPKLTPGQRRARREAVAVLTAQGFEPVRLSDYEPEDELRVLVGRPAVDGTGDQRAFFFLRREFIGYDSESASAKLRVVRTRERTITLAYGVYEPGDRRCCPKGGTARVRFRWDGATLAPLDELPVATARVLVG